jgi:phage terminase small subunit
MKRLTAKDRLFCFEYLADEKLNPERAAIKVGYSESVAKTKAYQWVSNSKENSKPQVKAFLDQLLKQRERNLEIDGRRIDEELAKIAFSNITDIIETMGGHINLKLLKNLAEDQKHAIAEISESELQGVTTRNIKLHSKLRALELLIKRIGKGEGSRYLTVNIYQDGKLIESKTREIGSQ